MSDSRWTIASLVILSACIGILAFAPPPLGPAARMLLVALLLIATVLLLVQAFRARQPASSPLDTGNASYAGSDASLRPPEAQESPVAGGDDSKARRLDKALPEVHISNLTAAYGLLDKMTEQERLDLLQLRARQDAVTAREARYQFVGSLSHEVRTPMNAVLGMLDMLRLTSLTRKQEAYIRVMESSSSMLLSLLDNMIDFASLESGGLQLKEDTFGASELLESILEVMGYQAQMKGLELVGIGDFEPDTDLVGDFVRLRQIMINLVNNGIKFTEQGSVTVRVTVEADQEDASLLTVSVRDTGIGMSAEVARELVDAPPLANAFSSGHLGSGLGIAITKMLIDMMDGHIRYDSQPGKGTEVNFTVPLGNAPTSERRVNRFHNIFGSRRLMILSRNPAVAESICSFLRVFDVRCEPESHPDRALARLVEAGRGDNGFDGIIIDDEPNELLPLARSFRECSDIPIALLTPISRPLRVGEVSKIGRIRCVNKPVVPSELYTNLSRLLDVAGDDAYAVRDDSFRPMQILVGEDNPLNRRVLCSMLESIGYDPDTAEDGPGVLAAAGEKDYDLILMDCQMPGLDGDQVTAKIRERTAGTDMSPVIVAVTADVSKRNRNRCREVGMDDFLAKPVRLDRLRSGIRRWSEIVHTRQERSRNFRNDTVVADGAFLLQQQKGFGNIATLREYIDLFIDDTSSRIARLRLALQHEDFEVLRRESHALKGACLEVGASRLCMCCDSLLQASRDQRVEDLPVAFEELAMEFDRIKPVFEAEKQGTF